jgi:hypothetical protein
MPLKDRIPRSESRIDRELHGEPCGRRIGLALLTLRAKEVRSGMCGHSSIQRRTPVTGSECEANNEKGERLS